LADALTDYRGTICFITHDRTLIRRLANKIVEVDAGKIVVFPGDYDSYVYRKPMTDEDSSNATSRHQNITGNRFNNDRVDGKRLQRGQLQKTLGRESARLARHILVISGKLESLESRLNELEARFADPSQFRDNEQLIVSGEQYRDLKNEEQALWKDWERLSSEADVIDKELAELQGDTSKI
jgi:ATP-binding cassette subfamily F protein 3